MVYKYTDYKNKVSEILQDKAEKLLSTERDHYLQEAVGTYSKHRPREIIEDITGDGTYDYSIATHLISWIKGSSVIKSIEYPANQRVPEYLEEGDDGRSFDP